MARLKVGDLVIDGNYVSFDGKFPEPPSKPTPQTAPDLADLTHKIPLGVKQLSVASLVLIALALPLIWASNLVGFLVGHSDIAMGWLLAALPLTTAGMGFAGLAVAKRLSEPVLPTQPAIPSLAEPVLKQRVARIQPLLETGESTNTVEAIARQTGLTEHAVIQTLVVLKERREIEEEVNLQTGEWYYRLAQQERMASREPTYLTLEERAAMNMEVEESE